MRVISVYNNNVVLAKDEKNSEVIVVGSGVGFQKKPGSLVDKSSITRIFYTKNEGHDDLLELLSRIPAETFEITQTILEEALGGEENVQDRLVIVLADHISIALSRAKKGQFATNLVLSEIKFLYEEEYRDGLKALDIIEKMTGISLPDDEAGYIAMHLANAKMGDTKGKPAQIIQFVKDVMLIIRYSLDLDLPEDNLDYYRLSTHLKFLGYRIFQNEHLQNKQDEQNFALYLLMKETNKLENRCVEQIGEYTENNYNYPLNPSEKLYLLIHITRCRSDLVENRR